MPEFDLVLTKSLSHDVAVALLDLLPVVAIVLYALLCILILPATTDLTQSHPLHPPLHPHFDIQHYDRKLPILITDAIAGGFTIPTEDFVFSLILELHSILLLISVVIQLQLQLQFLLLSLCHFSSPSLNSTYRTFLGWNCINCVVLFNEKIICCLPRSCKSFCISRQILFLNFSFYPVLNVNYSEISVKIQTSNMNH